MTSLGTVGCFCFFVFLVWVVYYYEIGYERHHKRKTLAQEIIDTAREFRAALEEKEEFRGGDSLTGYDDDDEVDRRIKEDRDRRLSDDIFAAALRSRVNLSENEVKLFGNVFYVNRTINNYKSYVMKRLFEEGYENVTVE